MPVTRGFAQAGLTENVSAVVLLFGFGYGLTEFYWAKVVNSAIVNLMG
jgi:hypothetical protein